MAGNKIVIVAFVFMQTIHLGISYPKPDDFFFNDQPDVSKKFIDEKASSNKDLKEYFEVILNESEVGPDEEGSGMGSGSGSGFGSGDGSEETLGFQSTSSSMLTEVEEITKITMPQETDTVFDTTFKSTEIEEKSIEETETTELEQYLIAASSEEVIEESTSVRNIDITEKTEETTASSSSDYTDPSTEKITKSVQETNSSEKTDPVTDEVTSDIKDTEISTSRQDIEFTTNISKVKPKQLKLLSIQVCGKKFYCSAGSRGPCAANEILADDESAINDNSTLSCSAFFSFPWSSCYLHISPEKASLSLAGKCVLKSKENPCSGLPANYRYNEKRKACRPISSVSGDWLTPDVCGEDQVFIGSNGDVGSCRCRNKHHIRYSPDNRCYHPYSQGPCAYGFWLVPSSRSEMNCLPSPCPELADGKHFFWNGHFYGNAGCYRSYTQGPCPKGRIFVVNNVILGHARCRYV